MDNIGARQPPQGRQQRMMFSFQDESYTPEMYMDDLERCGPTLDADPSYLIAPVLRYPLCPPASSGRTDIVQFMLGQGYDKDVLDANGQTPLRLAAKRDHSSVARALLDAGADISLRSADHQSALDYAATMGHVGVATVLIDYGADVNAAAVDGTTPLHSAAAYGEAETASLLLTNGATVDAWDDDGYTPLMMAAIGGHAAATQVLLAAGANATLRNDETGMSALDKAAHDGHVDVLRAIIEHGVDVNAAGSSGFTALHMAAFSDKAAAIERLAEAGANIDQEAEANGPTPLHIAAYFCRLASVVALLKRGACVHSRNAIGRTPLHAAAAKAGKVGNAQVVDLLLRHGADEKAGTSDGQVPADMLASEIDEEDSVGEDVERVRKLLANAPADRVWRRRGFLVVCRAHYPRGRVQLGQGSSHGHDTSIAKRTRSHVGPSKAEAKWAVVASMLIGAGADPISLMGDGADLIFETIVGYL